MATALPQEITETGLSQGSFVILLQNVQTLVNELHADHATNKTIIDELKTDYTALLADVTAIRAEVVKLVTDMGTRITENNTLATKLNNDAGVTDVDYAAAAAITAANPAALTATAIAASSAATLTATTVVLTKG